MQPNHQLTGLKLQTKLLLRNGAIPETPEVRKLNNIKHKPLSLELSELPHDLHGLQVPALIPKRRRRRIDAILILPQVITYANWRDMK